MRELYFQNLTSCDIPGDLSYVSEAATNLKEFCDLRLLDSTVWPNIELGFCEALNNAIEHGCGEDTSKTVRVTWQWNHETLIIEIEDPGTYVELQPHAHLPEDPLNESGRGCFLISSIFDSVTHHKTKYGRKLTLEKKLHPPQSALDKMQELYESLQSTVGELNQSYTEQAAIQGFAQDLGSVSTLLEAISSSLSRLQSAFNIPQAEIWILQEGRLENPLNLQQSKLDLTSNSSNTIEQTFRDQRERIVTDCSQLPESDPIFSKTNCALLSPITYHNESVGVIAIQLPKVDVHQFETKIARLARVFSRFLAIAITNASTIDQKKENERSRTQLEIASEIQQSLLPSEFPCNEHYKLTGKCVTALAVGGDYIDAIDIKGHGLLMIIADVMGKGVPAALLATIFRTAIRSRLNLAETPGWLLSQINKQIHEELGHLNMFITAQAAYYSYENYRLKLASAGHCPAFLSRKGTREPEQLDAEGIPLGICPDDIYEERLIQLTSGDRIVFITDGIYEAENQSGQMLGIEGFSKRLPEIWQEGIEAVPNNALSVVDVFSQGGAAQDDKTLMALEIL